MSLLPLLAINALFMMAAAGGLALTTDVPPQALAHLALALGALPLILAAMAYFVPVLTRSNATLPRSLSLAPLTAWLGAAALIAGFTGAMPYIAASHLAFLLASAATLALLLWAFGRRRRTVGRAHPGLNWYLAALACFTLALLAVPLMSLWPSQHPALRLFHLHLNLLGFVGLTAIGTLQVLLPTTLSQPDPRAAQRLTQDLKYAIAGVLLLSAAAAWLPPLSLAGLILYLIAPLRMLWHWHEDYRQRLTGENRANCIHGAAISLILACTGLIGLLLLGLSHSGTMLAGLNGRAGIAAFVLAFLLPLVSGAATQLLPVWLRPGPQGEWHKRMRASLGRQAGLRAGLMVTGGWALAFGSLAGAWLGAAGMAILIVTFLRGLCFTRPWPRQGKLNSP